MGHGLRVTPFGLGFPLWSMEDRLLVQGSVILKLKRDFTPRQIPLLSFAPEWSCETAFLDLFFYVEYRYSSLFKPNIHTTCPPLSLESRFLLSYLSQDKCCCQSSVIWIMEREIGRIYLPGIPRMPWAGLQLALQIAALQKAPYDSGRTCPL